MGTVSHYSKHLLCLGTHSVHGPEAHLLDHSSGDKSCKDGFDFGEPPNAVQQEIKRKHSQRFVRNTVMFKKHRH